MGNNKNFDVQEDILFEDNHLIIVNKKSGVLVQGDKTGDTPLMDLIKNYLKEKYHKKGNVFLGVPHRLDRPTTGAIIFTKTSKALTRINDMLRAKNIKKTYWAVVKNKPKQNKETLTHYLLKNHKNNKSTVFINSTKNAKKAVLHYKYLRSLANYYLLEIHLETGRHHQIRAQLAFIQCAIKGDLKYGSKRSNKDGSIHLHARFLELTHPVKKTPLKIIAPLPKNDAIWKSLTT